MLSGIVVGYLATEFRMILLLPVEFWSGERFTPRPILAISLPEFVAQVSLYGITVLNTYLIRRFVQLNEKGRENDRLAMEKLRLETSLRQAELEVLRMRLNPHFLFNTLQNISVLVDHEPETASRMLARLGDLLRAAFRRDSQPEVTLQLELSLTQAYLDVEKIRFGDRLEVSIQIAPGTAKALVPTLLLQPLVENAIIHGLRTMTSGNIVIRSAIEENNLLLSVLDDGAGPPAERLGEWQLGVGLGSTCERLAQAPTRSKCARSKAAEPKFAWYYLCASEKRQGMRPNMSKLRLLIVDDEPVIRLGLRSGLAKLNGTEVTGECASGGEAIDAILSQQPDVVFLDVQLPDCSGLDVIRQVGPERMPMVVFVTAFDEYAVKAFELNAVDYLLKPFDQERLQASVERARQRLATQNPAEIAVEVRALLQGVDHTLPDRLVVRNSNRHEFVPVESIDWIESANNYVQLHCGNKTHLLSETLSGLERKLAPNMFLRIHRCRIVNVSRIAAVHSGFDEAYELEMRNGVRLMSGRQFKRAIQSLIGR